MVFKGRILDGSRCHKKKSFLTRKRGHYYRTLLCNIPLPDPLYCLQYCAIYFPHDPLYCNTILAISCKGQPRSQMFPPTRAGSPRQAGGIALGHRCSPHPG